MAAPVHGEIIGAHGLNLPRESLSVMTVFYICSLAVTSCHLVNKCGLV
uniref:Uncharacterized protein n=1 Tax=Anguilla anguilla TaxID=7936 RepID=A0A0E9UV84_ANGAN